MIFSTKDLLVAGTFAGCAFLVGGAIYLLGLLGVTEPHRLMLGLVGGMIVFVAVLISRANTQHRIN